MMEANPLSGVQTVATHSTRSSQQVQSEEGNNFEQQLSNQLVQANPASKTGNSESNQLLEDSDDRLDVDLAAHLESTEVLFSENSDLPLAVNAVALEATEETPQVLLSTVETDSEVQPVVSQLDQTVPLAGNPLPPINSLLSANEPPIPLQNPSYTPGANSTSTHAVVNTPVVQVVLDSAKPNQAPASVNNPVVDGELVDKTAGFQDMEIIAANSDKQETNPQANQSRPGISIASSVAATASQLQQVPSSTASANLNFSLSSFPVDSMLSVAVNQTGPGITSTVQSQSWSQGLTEQVAWMVRGNIQSADIRLNPANLGPLEVKLSIEDDVARLSFVTSHAPVREALEAAVPRLREMLEQQGINLADVDISQHSEQGQQSADQASEGSETLVNHADANIGSSDLADEVQGVSQILMNDGLSIYA